MVNPESISGKVLALLRIYKGRFLSIKVIASETGIMAEYPSNHPFYSIQGKVGNAIHNLRAEGYQIETRRDKHETSYAFLGEGRGVPPVSEPMRWLAIIPFNKRELAEQTATGLRQLLHRRVIVRQMPFPT